MVWVDSLMHFALLVVVGTDSTGGSGLGKINHTEAPRSGAVSPTPLPCSAGSGPGNMERIWTGGSGLGRFHDARHPPRSGAGNMERGGIAEVALRST